MSGGSLILAGGADGKRAALPNARILIHQPSSGFQGQSTDIEIHARGPSLRRRTEIYARHTGQTLEQLHGEHGRDRFFSAAEAVDYGLVDRGGRGAQAAAADAGFAASGRSGAIGRSQLSAARRRGPGDRAG